MRTHRIAIAIAIATAALLICAAARPAAGQELEQPRQRQGYYAAFGAHGAVQHHRDDGDGLGVWGGFATTLRLGQLLTRRFGAGIQLDVGGSSSADQSASLIGLGLEGQVELIDNLALHAVLGLGVVTVQDPDEEELRGGYGAAYTLALTYDWFPGHRRTGGWAVTPGLQLRALPADPVSSYGVLIGVELSYWTGLPRNQVDLPPGEAFARR